MSEENFSKALQNKFEIHQWGHAVSIMKHDFPHEWRDLCAMLRQFKLLKSWIQSSGGNKSKVSMWVENFLSSRKWDEKTFNISISIDERARRSPTHKVDCFKNGIAFECEWNNKDTFYDRDLNNFRLLHEIKAISLGIIFTRSDSLKDVFAKLGCSRKYGESTTHMGKLLPRINGGGGGGCPLIIVGIKGNR